MAKDKEKEHQDQSYGADSITVLKGLEPVRLRPGMYIGDTGETGLNHLIKEAIDNSLDEAAVGVASFVKVTFLPDNYVEIEDDGRGIPTGIHSEMKVSTLEVVLSRLHAGGKFNNTSDKSGYSRTPSAGLHGVGIKAITALSKDMEVRVVRDGKEWMQTYSQGVKTCDVKEIGKRDKNEHGTIFKFQADDEIFETIEFNLDTIAQRLEEIAYLQPGFRTILIDARKKKDDPIKKEWFSKQGLAQMMTKVAKSKPFLFTPIAAKKKGKITFSHGPMKGKQGDISVEAWFTYLQDSDADITRSFANNVSTPLHGTHVNGFELGLFDVIRELVKDDPRLRGIKTEVTRNDAVEGAVAVISVRLPEPQFEGQTKGKLGNPELKTVVRELITESLLKEFDRNPNIKQLVKDKVVNSILMRDAARKAREGIKKKSAHIIIPDKLSDCSEDDPDLREIWIVEGESAGGSAKNGRDRKTQAVLAMRGKILNTQELNVNRLFENKEIKDICDAVGLGLEKDPDTGQFQLIPRLRYRKIILAADADPDGDHIRCLLLVLFFKHAPEVIREGCLFLAQPPLFCVRKRSTGEPIEYLLDDAAKKEYEKKHDCTSKTSKFEITRFKGLGEMDALQLGETTMNKQTRHLKQVVIHDTDDADKMAQILMGKNVAGRKTFLEEHARDVDLLAIAG